MVFGTHSHSSLGTLPSFSLSPGFTFPSSKPLPTSPSSRHGFFNELKQFRPLFQLLAHSVCFSLLVLFFTRQWKWSNQSENSALPLWKEWNWEKQRCVCVARAKKGWLATSSGDSRWCARWGISTLLRQSKLYRSFLRKRLVFLFSLESHIVPIFLHPLSSHFWECLFHPHSFSFSISPKSHNLLPNLSLVNWNRRKTRWDCGLLVICCDRLNGRWGVQTVL